MKHYRTGFSFTEVLFAVMVLAIGFIMIAAIFPVAIMQSKTTTEETVGSTLVRGAVSVMQTVATDVTMPAHPTAGPSPVKPFIATPASATSGDWNAVRQNLILQNDPRYAWVPLYRRDAGSSYAQLFIIPVESRVRTNFDAADVQLADANLHARPIEVDISNDPDLITFTDSTLAGATGSVVEGCYVIIADDNLGGGSAGLLNGYIYRVGNPTGVANQYELMPGSDFSPHAGADGILGNGDDITSLAGADAFIVGRGRTGVSTFEGTAQDISIYTTFISVR